MDMSEYFRFIAAFTLVLGLMWGLAHVLRYANNRRTNLPGLTVKRLNILEMKQIDPRHRLVLIAKDDMEHLIVLGNDSQTLISSTPRKQDSAA